MNLRSKVAAANRTLAVFTLLAVSVLFSGTALCQTYWYETYQRAVELIDEGDTIAATPLVDRLIQEHPREVAGSASALRVVDVRLSPARYRPRTARGL